MHLASSQTEAILRGSMRLPICGTGLMPFGRCD